jgi:transposase
MVRTDSARFSCGVRFPNWRSTAWSFGICSGTATARDDGYLSASEVASLKLDADWVILSACNTADSAGGSMKRFVAEADRGQWTLLPECLDDFIAESNPVRVVDAFVAAVDLAELGFDGVEPAATGRPAYHPSTLLKLYIYGYLNRVQSSRWLEREAGRNLEVMWLLGRLVPDHKTIADFRKDNGPAIRKVCARFVELCRQMGLLRKASVAIDGSKFKAVN